MNEYIEREAVCYQLKKQESIDGQPGAIRRARRIVANFPAADVAPVVHAHWEEDPVFDNFYRCSHCYAGLKSDCTVLVGEKYCGNCGARMDERSEDDV